MMPKSVYELLQEQDVVLTSEHSVGRDRDLADEVDRPDGQTLP
jgi:hypothetical protein